MANEQTSVPLYAASEVLTAANMNISAGTGVPVFATTVTRDAAFGGASEKVLAEGQLCYLSSTNVVQYYDGAAWATVGPAAAATSGLTFITGATFTTATNFSLAANTFSATYKNYRILINVNAVTADVDVTMRLRAAGTDASGSDYQFAFQGLGGNGTADNATSAGTTAWTVGDIDSANPFYACSLDIMQPQASGFTSILGNMAFVEKPAVYSLYRFGGGWYQQTTSFDSLSFISSVASSITGNYRVYGYAES